MKARVFVTLKQGVLDPQGQAVRNTLGRLGYADVSNVRIGKLVELELEGTDDRAYEKIQYRRLADLVALLRRAYPSLQDAEIVGHSDIAPGRKTDPGDAFDWNLLYRLLES